MDGSFLKSVAIGGYDKKDVLNYIDELNGKLLKFESDAASARGELVVARQGLADAKEKLAALEGATERVAQLEAELEREHQQAAAHKASVDNLTDELIRQKGLFTAKEKEIAELTGQLAQERARQAELAEKNRQYETTASDIGGILIDARRAADEIIRDAGHQAEKVLAQSAHQRAALHEQIAIMTSRLGGIGKTIEAFCKDSDHALADMEQQLASAREALAVEGVEKTPEPSVRPVEPFFPEIPAEETGDAPLAETERNVFI